MTTPMTVPVSEVFGPTWQGEGPHCGRRVWFVRLGLCNLSCEWCDTPYTWDRTRFDVDTECPPVDVEQLAVRVVATGARTVVVSGGEPLMHHRQLDRLTAMLPQIEWHVESNGTIIPPAWWGDAIAHTSLSPKVGTRDPENKRIKPRAFAAWREHAEHGRACFKFVCRTEADIDTVDDLVVRFALDPGWVWIMPEGVTADAVLDRHRVLAERIMGSGYNTTTRLHTLLWGNERGR